MHFSSLGDFFNFIFQPFYCYFNFIPISFPLSILCDFFFCFFIFLNNIFFLFNGCNILLFRSHSINLYNRFLLITLLFFLGFFFLQFFFPKYFLLILVFWLFREKINGFPWMSMTFKWKKCQSITKFHLHRWALLTSELNCRESLAMAPLLVGERVGGHSLRLWYSFFFLLLQGEVFQFSDSKIQTFQSVFLGEAKQE